METFTFCPRIDPVGQITQRSIVAQFGDGYAQRAADGINGKSENWPLEFVGSEDYIRPIRDFLDRHQGYKSFLWTPPLGEPQHFVTPEGYSLRAMGGGAYSLSVTFVQNNRLI